MRNKNADHVRVLRDLFLSDAMTPSQKMALKYGMIALRDCGKDYSVDRLIGGTLAVQDGPDIGVPTSVYKYFDRSGVLIYVGITKTGILRNRQHNGSKEWWKFVQRQEVEHFRSRADAHEREIALIERFRPPFNKQHNVDYPAIRQFYLDMVAGLVARPRPVRPQKALHNRKPLIFKSA